MKIFLVLEDFGHEGFEIAGIYSNRQAAKKKMDDLLAGQPSWQIRLEETELLDE